MGVALVVVSACAFGSVALFVEPIYAAGVSPIVLLTWRFALAALVSWGYLLARRRTRSSLLRLSRRRVTILVLLGALYVGNSFTYIGALQSVPISLNSIIAYLYPAIVAVMALRLVRRLEGRRAYVALALSLLGVGLALGGVPSGEMPPLWGLALSFANPFIYATWIIFQSRLAGDRPAAERPTDAGGVVTGSRSHPDVPDPAAAAALMMTATAAVYLGIAVVTGAPISPASMPADAWLPIIGLSTIATAVAIQTFYAGVKRVGGARASLISTVEPVYTIVLAMLLFGEHLEPVQVLGGALVLAAVILAETGRRREDALTGADAGADAPVAPGVALADSMAVSTPSPGGD